MSQSTQPEAVMIDNLDQFVKALYNWHSNKVKLLKHMASIPEGTEVTEDNGNPKVLTGDYREGFILGLNYALSELGELPFEAEVEFTSEELVITDPAGTVH